MTCSPRGAWTMASRGHAGADVWTVATRGFFLHEEPACFIEEFFSDLRKIGKEVTG
jgi:hypothetical protein